MASHSCWHAATRRTVSHQVLPILHVCFVRNIAKIFVLVVLCYTHRLPNAFKLDSTLETEGFGRGLSSTPAESNGCSGTYCGKDRSNPILLFLAVVLEFYVLSDTAEAHFVPIVEELAR